MSNNVGYKNYIDKIDKEKAFDELAKLFYDRNFGSASKSDIELLMFKFLIGSMQANNSSATGNTIDQYIECSDYKISKILGITQQRVRNLKVKKELVYHDDDFDWHKSFADLLANSRYTTFENNRVIINIPDPNLQMEIQNFIEENGGFVDYHLNRKLLDTRIEFLLDFAVLFEKESADEVYKKAKAELKNLNIKAKIEDFKSLGKTVLDCGMSILELKNVFSSGNCIIKLLKKQLT